MHDINKTGLEYFVILILINIVCKNTEEVFKNYITIFKLFKNHSTYFNNWRLFKIDNLEIMSKKVKILCSLECIFYVCVSWFFVSLNKMLFLVIKTNDNKINVNQ